MLHIAGGLPALCLPFIPVWLALTGAIAGVLLTFTIRPQLALWLRYVSKPSDRAKGEIRGFISYSLAVLSLVLLWLVLTPYISGAVYFCMFGWLALALGDGLAGMIGPSPRQAPTVPWNQSKTWWGALGCLGGTAIAWQIAFSPVWPGNPPLTLGIAGVLALSAFVALLESLPWKLDDNYTVGTGSALAALVVYVLSSSQ